MPLLRLIKCLWPPLIAGCAVLGAPQQLRAQTLQNFLQNGSFSYGDETFSISNCGLSGAACTKATNIQVVGVFNNRTGTEIALVTNSTAQSYIVQSGARGPNDTLSFTLKVIGQTGSGGLSSITNILNASTTATTAADNTLISSRIDGFTNVSKLQYVSATANIGAPSASNSFALTQSPLSSPVGFNVNIAYNSTNPVGTLTLNNVRFLFSPAPEPASIALLATGLTGLAALRRRSRRRHQPQNRPIVTSAS